MRTAAWLALAADIVLVSALFLPIAPIGSRWFHWASGINGDLPEEIGWPELVREVARIRDSLPVQDRPHVGIVGTNYGEAGAVNLYGPNYGLPTAMSGVNSFWYRGYGDPPPQVLIVLGLSQREMQRRFQSCDLAGHTPRIDDVRNEETEDHPGTYLFAAASRRAGPTSGTTSTTTAKSGTPGSHPFAPKGFSSEQKEWE